MAGAELLDRSRCWQISGVHDAEAFFRALPLLTPDATHLLLEGAPSRDVLSTIATHRDEEGEYEAPRGTMWSWPGRNRRLTLRTSLALYAALGEAASRHAVPEVCYHLHLYQDDRPLVQWFDAFDDSLLVTADIPRAHVEQFCSETGGVISASAA